MTHPYLVPGPMTSPLRECCQSASGISEVPSGAAGPIDRLGDLGRAGVRLDADVDVRDPGRGQVAVGGDLPARARAEMQDLRALLADQVVAVGGGPAGGQRALQ